MTARVDDVEPGAHDAHRRRPARAAGDPGGRHRPRRARARTPPPRPAAPNRSPSWRRHVEAVAGAPTGADDADPSPVERREVAPTEQHGRRLGVVPQRRRVVRMAAAHDQHAGVEVSLPERIEVDGRPGRVRSGTTPPRGRSDSSSRIVAGPTPGIEATPRDMPHRAAPTVRGRRHQRASRRRPRRRPGAAVAAGRRRDRVGLTGSGQHGPRHVRPPRGAGPAGSGPCGRGRRSAGPS